VVGVRRPGIVLAPRHLALVVAVVAFGFALPALAQATKTAKEYARQAGFEYNLGRFAEAATLFEKAYRIDPAPVLLFNIGQSYRRLGNTERALFFYRRYLEEAAANVPDRKDVEARIAELERSLHEPADVQTRSPPGIQSETSSSSQPAQGRSNTVPEPAAPIASVTSGPAASPVSLVSLSDEGDRDSWRRVRRLAWIAGAAAAASMIFGGVEAVLWSRRAQRFDEHVGPSLDDPARASRNCGADEPNRGGMGCAALYDDMTSARALAIGGLAAGVGLAATSIVLFVRSEAGDRGSARAALACIPTVSSTGVACRVSF
jgi:tetratricopeptide (TPR) repeat protein